MEAYTGTVFDEFIDTGATTSYSAIEHMERLANGAQIGVIAVCTEPSNVDAELMVVLEHSADGISFKAKTNGTLINSVSIAATGAGPVVLSGGEPSPAQPSMRYVRLAITVMSSDKITSRAARVRIAATVRGSAPWPAEPPPPRLLPAGSLARTLQRHARVMGEIQEIARVSSDMPAASRAEYVLANLTSEHKDHFRDVERRLQRLPPATRTLLAQTTAGLVRHALDVAGKRHVPSSCCDESTFAEDPCGCAPGSKK